MFQQFTQKFLKIDDASHTDNHQIFSSPSYLGFGPALARVMFMDFAQVSSTSLVHSQTFENVN